MIKKKNKKDKSNNKINLEVKIWNIYKDIQEQHNSIKKKLCYYRIICQRKSCREKKKLFKTWKTLDASILYKYYINKQRCTNCE